MRRLLERRSEGRVHGCSWGAAIALGACAVLPTLGCSGDLVPTRPGADSSTGDLGSTSTTSPDPSSTVGSTTATADGTAGTTVEEPPPTLFFAEPDLGSGSDCDIFTQDCPAGLKCIPWANDGGSAWNDWGCWPVADDPVGIGEVCHVEGSGTSGIDDCEPGAMCWDVVPETNEGTCMPLCLGGWGGLLCDDPDRVCRVAADAAIVLCMPTCDPLQQDCPEGQSCIPIQSYPACAPDASGDMGAYGDPCEFVNVCDPGLVCLGPAAVPPGQACEGAGGCCTELCDLLDPLGDLQCMGAAEGQQCLPWYEPGTAPPGDEDVGVCTLP